MRSWSPAAVADAAGASLRVGEPAGSGPESVTIDSRQAGPGALFVGLPGERVDGGGFARAALQAGAWGVLIAPEHADAIAESDPAGAGVLLAAEDPLRALQRLATAWRRELGARVIGVTGSTGKTSTKDILLAVLTPSVAARASRANFNTEIGLPLEILATPPGTEVLVLEMGMRGSGQIAELAGIAEPDVAVIVTVGPVHLELLGSIEAIAAAKAELISALKPGGAAVIPADEPLLAPHLRTDVYTTTFGPGGDVELVAADGELLTITMPGGGRRRITFPLPQAHLRTNLLAAVAAAHAIGLAPPDAVTPALSSGRGQRLEVGGGATLIDDCYNANPMSMRAALDDLAATAAAGPAGRRVAVLGDMLELGPSARDYHVEIGRHAAAAGVDVLVTVGPLAASIADGYSGAGEAHATADAHAAAELVAGLVKGGDVVLVKASRGVGLEAVCAALAAETVRG